MVSQIQFEQKEREREQERKRKEKDERLIKEEEEVEPELLKELRLLKKKLDIALEQNRRRDEIKACVDAKEEEEKEMAKRATRRENSSRESQRRRKSTIEKRLQMTCSGRQNQSSMLKERAPGRRLQLNKERILRRRPYCSRLSQLPQADEYDTECSLETL